MRIRSLKVEGFGRFAQAAHVEGFADGVNVLAAGNEAGKSTLFRAIRHCLFSRHDGKGAEIEGMASEGSQLPMSVELAFEHDEKSYVIAKRFLRSPGATLTENGREIARAKQADEAVWRLLGLNPGGGRRSIDDGAFGVLWVGQRGSLTAPTPGAGASSALHEAISSEVGALVGGERARRVLDETRVELARTLTDTDRAKVDGPLHAARQEKARWQAAQAEAEVKLAELDRQFSTLADLRQRRARADDPEEVARLSEELATARRAVEDARLSKEELARIEAQEGRQRLALEQAQQKLQRFRDLAARIDTERAREAELLATLPGLRARDAEARGALARTPDQIDMVEKTARDIDARERQVEMLATAATRARRREDIAGELAALDEAATQLRDIDARLNQIKIEPRAVGELDALDRDIAMHDAQMSAAAARLRIEVTPAGAGKISIDGAPIDGGHDASVLAPIAIAIADWATIVLTPAATPGRDKRRALIEKRDAMLASAGVATVADARALLQTLRDTEAQRKGLIEGLKTLRAGADPQRGVDARRAEIADIDASVATARAAAGTDVLPSPEDLDAMRRDIEMRRAPIESQRARLRALHKRQQTAASEAVAALTAAEANVTSLRDRLAGDVALCPDGERVTAEADFLAALDKARDAHRAATDLLVARRASAPDADEESRREARRARLEQAHANRQREQADLDREIHRLTGVIQASGGDGVGEALAEARDRHAIAEQDLSRVEERVETLKLLRDTVSACLAEGRERFYEPVRKHLRPFLNDVFPGAELELGDRFVIERVRRDRAEDFTRLSDGTQEQIAVLTRLAMASLLAERGQSVPVILDDALVYSDDDRIQRMFDALSRAGKKQQIIVLTCRLRAFSALGGNILRVRGSSEA